MTEHDVDKRLNEIYSALGGMRTRLRQDYSQTEARDTLEIFINVISEQVNNLTAHRQYLTAHRGKNCVCYKYNLRTGTATPGCRVCLDAGYIPTLNPNMQGIHQELKRIGQLPLNWDQLGSKPITNATLELAQRVADVIEPTITTEVIPNSDGSVEFVKTNAHGNIERFNVISDRDG